MSIKHDLERRTRKARVQEDPIDVCLSIVQSAADDGRDYMNIAFDRLDGECDSSYLNLVNDPGAQDQLIASITEQWGVVCYRINEETMRISWSAYVNCPTC